MESSRNVYDEKNSEPVDKSGLLSQEKDLNLPIHPSGANNNSTTSAGGGSSSSTNSSSGGSSNSTGEGDSGFFNSNSTSDVPHKLNQAENFSFNANPSSSVTGNPVGLNGIKNFFWGSSKRRRNSLIGGGVMGAIIGGVISLSVVSGPLEFVHIAQLMEKFHFSSIEDAQNGRLEKIAQYIYDPNRPERTRLGLVGNAVADSLEAKIRSETGLSPHYKNGSFQGWVADDERFNGYSNDEIKQAMAQDLNIDASDIGTVTINGKEMPIYNPEKGGLHLVSNYFSETKTARSLLGDAGLNDVTAYMGSRVLKSRAGWSFHPINALDTAYQQKVYEGLKSVTDKLKETFNSQETTDIETGSTSPPVIDESGSEQNANGQPVTDPVREGAAGAGNNIESNPSESNITGKIVGSGAAVIGVACLMNGINKSVPALRAAKVMIPMMKFAGQFINLGSQIQSGQDIDTTQLGFFNQFIDGTNSQGQTTSTWDQAKSIQAELGEPETGPDLPKSAQVFNSGVPFAFLNSLQPGLNTTCNILGSPLGTIVNAVIAPFSTLFQTFAVGPVLKDVVSSLANWLTGVPINIFKGAGATDGNYINYGSRLSANEQFASAGGVSLSSSQESSVNQTSLALNNSDFESKSLAYRIFNPDDDQSLASKVIDNYGVQSASQDMASIFSGAGNIFSSALKNTASLFSGLLHANAAQPPYTYNGLQAVGFTAGDLANPNYSDPFVVGCEVAGGPGCPSSDGNGILGDPTDPNSAFNQVYKNKILTCFGDTVTYNTSEGQGGAWDISFTNTQPIDMYGSPSENTPYQQADCGSTDPNWTAIRFWILDTQTIESYDCYQGNTSTADQSCQDLGVDSSPPPTNSTNSSSNAYFTVKGNVIDGPNGNQFVPYGISVIDDLDQTNWQNYEAASDAQIQAAAKYWHINSIRLQVSEDNIMDSPSPNESYNTAAMQRLGAEIDEIESLGKIPIINDNTEITNPSQHGPTDTTTAFWKALTTYLAAQNNAGKYTNVIFDIYNEPSDGGWSEWQKGGSGYVGMQNVVNSIRNGTYLNNNLIMVEGPYTATTLDQLDTYPITGSNLAFAYHHVDLDDPSSWDNNMGLNLKTSVPIIDGEWAQYAAQKSSRHECWPDAPQNIPAYFNKLTTNHIGLIFWALEPGVGTQTYNTPEPWSNTITKNFPTTASDYSQPNSFANNYSCTYGPGGVLIDQGSGADIMSYFQKMTGN